MNSSEHRAAAPVARIDRLALWTAQLERLSRFYAGQLGGRVSPVCEREDGAGRAVFLDFCAVGLELIEPPAGAAPPPDGRLGCAYIAFALGSADAVERLTARLAAAGHRVLEAPHRSREGSFVSAVLDPDGNRVELTV